MDVKYERLVYQVITDKSFDEAVEAIEVQTPAHAFRVLYIHDYQATLAEKGFTREPLKIIEVCNAELAHDAMPAHRLHRSRK